tara:strand:- start:811 stop:999 length:189 start_codon:yes stop_codon:yes gene_type:complete
MKVNMKFKDMKIREPKPDFRNRMTEQDGTAESGNYNKLKHSSVRVVKEEVIDGVKYKVLTVG